MTRTEMHKTVFRISVVVVFCLLQIQAFAPAAGQRNLALHKKLDYSPRPEYRLTVGPRDPFELTDGIKEKSLWYENHRGKTVGWVNVSLVEINLDLGQVHDVGLINIHTVGGGQSGVEYPEYAAAAVSLDGTDYSPSSYLSSDGWMFGTRNAVPKTIVLPVGRKARFIKLYIRPIGYFFFADEIEVIESQSVLKDIRARGYRRKDQVIDLVERARELDRGMHVLSETVDKSAQIPNGLAGDWPAMIEPISLLGRDLTEEKVASAEAAFAQLRAKWLKLEHKVDWLCCPAEPIDVLRYSDLPRSAPNDVQASLYQWENEHGVAAINLTNCSTAAISFTAHLSPLRLQDKTIESAGILELRRAMYVRVINAGLVADPLVLQNSEPVPGAPGQTVQLWLEAYSRGLDAGVYTAAMAIDATGDSIVKTQQTIPIRLEVADKKFPEKVPLYSCNWDYVSKSDRFTSKSPAQTQAALLDLEKHYANVFVVWYDRILVRDDTKTGLPLQELRDELALRSKANSFVLLFLGGQGAIERKFGAFRTPGWESEFKSFIAQLRDSMLGSGFEYDSFAIYPFDEYIGDDFVYVARMIRDCDPKLKIYANRWFESDSQFRQVKDLIDIWCPYSSEMLANRGKFEYYREHGGFDKIWCYNTTLTCKYVFAPPYIRKAAEWQANSRMFWRLLPVAAACFGLDGVGFWVYQDADMSGWIKDKTGDYGVVYDGSQNPDKDCIAELIVPSRRWQQWREGVEDAVCLKGHEKLLDEFFQTSSSKVTSEYLTSLRRRADEEKGSVK